MLQCWGSMRFSCDFHLCHVLLLMLKLCLRQQMWMEFTIVIQKNENAALLNHVWYQEVALKNLLVMDITAITLCQENQNPDKKDLTSLISCLSSSSISLMFLHHVLSSDGEKTDRVIKHYQRLRCWLHAYFDILLVVQLWVFNVNKPGNISKALSGEWIRTLISDAGLNSEPNTLNSQKWASHFNH